MWLAPALIALVAVLQVPSTHAAPATTYNLPLLQETLEVLGGDIFMAVTNMINGAGNFNDEKEVKTYKKKPLYLQAVDQPGGIDGEDDDEKPEKEAAGKDKQEGVAEVTSVQTPAVETTSKPVSEDSVSPEDSEPEVVQVDSEDDSSQNGSSAEEEPAEEKDVQEFESKPDEVKEEEAGQEDKPEEGQDTRDEEETEVDQEDEDSDGAKELISSIVHFATDRVAKRLDQMNL